MPRSSHGCLRWSRRRSSHRLQGTMGRIEVEGSRVLSRIEPTRTDPALYSQPSHPAVMLEMVDFRWRSPRSMTLPFYLHPRIIRRLRSKSSQVVSGTIDADYFLQINQKGATPMWTSRFRIRPVHHHEVGWLR